jgi:hypothetical protein
MPNSLTHGVRIVIIEVFFNKLLAQQLLFRVARTE